MTIINLSPELKFEIKSMEAWLASLRVGCNYHLLHFPTLFCGVIIKQKTLKWLFGHLKNILVRTVITVCVVDKIVIALLLENETRWIFRIPRAKMRRITVSNLIMLSVKNIKIGKTRANTFRISGTGTVLHLTAVNINI